MYVINTRIYVHVINTSVFVHWCVYVHWCVCAIYICVCFCVFAVVFSYVLRGRVHMCNGLYVLYTYVYLYAYVYVYAHVYLYANVYTYAYVNRYAYVCVPESRLNPFFLGLDFFFLVHFFSSSKFTPAVFDEWCKTKK